MAGARGWRAACVSEFVEWRAATNFLWTHRHLRRLIVHFISHSAAAAAAGRPPRSTYTRWRNKYEHQLTVNRYIVTAVFSVKTKVGFDEIICHFGSNDDDTIRCNWKKYKCSQELTNCQLTLLNGTMEQDRNKKERRRIWNSNASPFLFISVLFHFENPDKRSGNWWKQRGRHRQSIVGMIY